VACHISEEPDEATVVHLAMVNRVLKDENRELRSYRIENKKLVDDIREIVEAYEDMLRVLESAYERNPLWRKYSRSRRPTVAGLRQVNNELERKQRLVLKDMKKEITKRDRKLATSEKRLEKFRQTVKELRKDVRAGQQQIERLEKEVIPLSFLRENVRQLEKELGKSGGVEARDKLKEMINELERIYAGSN